MKTIQTKLRVGPDGLLTLPLPRGMADTDVEVVVIIHPVGPNGPTPVTDPEAWKRFVADTSGSIEDPTFGRHEQGEFEQRDAWG